MKKTAAFLFALMAIFCATAQGNLLKALYYVRNKAVPAYITTVNTPSDLMFGTLNTK